MATLTWAFWDLAGWFPWGGLGGAVGSLLVVVWRTRRERGRWREHRAVDRALREHQDPGSAYRAAADRSARERLTRRTTFEIVVVTLCLGGPAVACVVTAAVRGDQAVALPSIPLIALVVWLTRRSRRERRETDRWLADPPFARAKEERP
jgi:hypothetical protein